MYLHHARQPIRSPSHKLLRKVTHLSVVASSPSSRRRHVPNPSHIDLATASS